MNSSGANATPAPAANMPPTNGMANGMANMGSSGAQGSGPMVTEGFCGSSKLMGMMLIAFLFFVLTPGVLLRFPTGYGKYAPAAVHGIIFAVVLRYVMGVY